MAVPRVSSGQTPVLAVSERSRHKKHLHDSGDGSGQLGCLQLPGPGRLAQGGFSAVAILQATGSRGPAASALVSESCL